jgi:hypothetical protein
MQIRRVPLPGITSSGVRLPLVKRAQAVRVARSASAVSARQRSCRGRFFSDPVSERCDSGGPLSPLLRQRNQPLARFPALPDPKHRSQRSVLGQLTDQGMVLRDPRSRFLIASSREIGEKAQRLGGFLGARSGSDSAGAAKLPPDLAAGQESGYDIDAESHDARIHTAPMEMQWRTKHTSSYP